MTTSVIETGLQFVRWFDEITLDDVPLVGGKNASLGEMCRELGPQGINLADGFAVTSEAYRLFLRETGLDEKVQAILADLDTSDMSNLQDRGRRVRHAILGAELPPSRRKAGSALAWTVRSIPFTGLRPLTFQFGKASVG
jgi:pyruvate,water dikinase